MFEQSQEEQQPCVMCEQHNEQMLMLSCVHDPCIDCAATHYVDNEPHNSSIYTCAKCGQETELDLSSIQELQRVYNSLKAKKRIDNRRNTPNSAYSQKERQERPVDKYPKSKPYEQPSEQSRVRDRDFQRGRDNEKTEKMRTKPVDYEGSYFGGQPQPQPAYNSVGKKGYQPTYPCIDHPEQELTYFCFTCNKPICPECAIHGFHKDHEVQTTRKAIKQIRLLLAEDRQKIDAEASALLSSKEKGKKIGRELAEENRRDQDYIKKKIAHLRNVLGEKEKELLKTADSNFDRNCELIRMESSASDKILDDIANSRKAIEGTLKREDLVILQQFNKRDEQVNSTLDRLEQEKEKQADYQRKNPNRSLDFNMFEDDLDRLLGDIHSLKLGTMPSKQ